MRIPTASGWLDGFRQTTTGDGAISISGAVATLSSGLNTGSAYFDKYVVSRPGEVLTFSVFARKLTGADPEAAGALKVEWPADNPGSGATVYVNSPEWREYEVSRGAGIAAATGIEHFNIAVGMFTADEGSIAVAHPRIKISNGGQGAARVHAYGMIRMTSGTPVVEADFVNTCITSATYDAGTKELTLQTPRGLTSIAGGAGAAPLLLCSMHSDNAATAHLTAKIGGYARGTGQCKVVFYDMTTGAAVDVSGIAGQFFISVLMVV